MIIFDVITCNRIYLSQPLVDKVINEISFESNRNSFVHSLSTVNEANWTITFVWLSWVCQKRKFDLWMACQTIMKKFIISKTLQHLGEVTKALVSCWYVKISLIRIKLSNGMFYIKFIQIYLMHIPRASKKLYAYLYQTS